MRTVPSALQTHLEGDLLNLAVLVKLTRSDGEVFGFTSHDRDIELLGVTYEALSSVSVSAIAASVSTGIDNLDILGLLQSDRITEVDLLAGRYDNARLVLYIVNWSDPDDEAIIMISGNLGNVTFEDGQFRAEFRSLSQRLAQQVGEITSPLCRAMLGDARCGLDIGDFQFSKTVTAVTDTRNFVFGSDAAASGYYSLGVVEFTTGLNEGISKEIKVHTLVSGEAVLELQEAFPFEVQVGDEATLTAGDDKRLETCRDKFSNAVNFRGEPFLPGTQKMMERGRN